MEQKSVNLMTNMMKNLHLPKNNPYKYTTNFKTIKSKNGTKYRYEIIIHDKSDNEDIEQRIAQFYELYEEEEDEEGLGILSKDLFEEFKIHNYTIRISNQKFFQHASKLFTNKTKLTKSTLYHYRRKVGAELPGVSSETRDSVSSLKAASLDTMDEGDTGDEE